MKFEESVKNISTSIELKRIASAYVIDSKNLNREELIQALLKTKNQYLLKENIFKSYQSITLSDKRDERVLMDIILKEILLNKDDYIKEQKLLDEKVVAYEQEIINISNELEEKDLSKESEFFKFIIETAWEQNNDISPDEKNLIEKIRNKLRLTQKEYRIIEAKLGKFPKLNNETHLRNEIDAVRKSLQSKGILFAVRGSDGKDFDVIPVEIANILNEIYGKEIRDYGYRQLLSSKYVRNKDYLFSILNKAGISFNNYAKLSQLQDLVFERIKPSNLLGGFSPKDGVEKDILYQWCSDLSLPLAGTKNEYIARIIEYYNGIKEIKIDSTDNREALFTVYEQLAKRDCKFLRKQGIIEKDLECEHKFEDATDYIFEKIFRHKPLLLTGTEHPDGILSYQNKLIMWDNKSKETSVRLKDHLSQFDRYIRNSEKPVSVFMVIAHDFTEDSATDCAKHALTSDTSLLLVKASDLKELAIKWQTSHYNDEESLNLGYFKQIGKFNKDYIQI